MNTMLRLRSVKLGIDTIEADFYPEDSENHGHIVVSLSDYKTISCNRVDGYGESYVFHARQRLVSMAKENNVMAECLVMWC